MIRLLAWWAFLTMAWEVIRGHNHRSDDLLHAAGGGGNTIPKQGME